MPRVHFDNRFLPDTTQRAIKYFYRARFANNRRTRYATRAVELLLIAAKAGNISAASMLGMVYYEGWGVPADALAAAHWLHRAAAEQHPLACFNLAVLYDNGTGVAKNPNTARRYYTIAARAGCPEAMYAVGSYYYWGHGVEPDYAKAKKWFRRSARSGNATAMQELGRIHQRNVNGGRNSALAIRWFRRALAAGDAKAAIGLGIEYVTLEDFPQARHYLEQAAENDQSHAMYLLGRWAEEGWDAVPNLADARFWFQEAANQGHEKAAWRLASIEGDLC
ncbi:tetratricopeptide repeat protein [Hymenobacter pini]|uniref:tetratricopeptide repeat protein n=1 Tax=Hymenobacter pini TaxID=2880879 RepID=UPI001CF4D1A7|nr:tetratricopeptide repeat protein [Hymenobacter pini]MCA8829969.1 sel1 repeat family protein [Hymenobacter pini]